MGGALGGSGLVIVRYLKSSVNPLYPTLAVQGILSGSNIAISNGNLQASWRSGSHSRFASSLGMSKGKWFCEFKVTNISGTYPEVGIISVPSLSLTGATYLVDSTGGNLAYAYIGNGLIESTATGSVAYGSSWYTTIGNVVGVFLDMDGGTLSFYLNGVSQGTAFLGLNTLGAFCFGGSLYASGAFSVNFGQSPFSYNPPTGVGLNFY